MGISIGRRATRAQGCADPFLAPFLSGPIAPEREASSEPRCDNLPNQDTRRNADKSGAPRRKDRSMHDDIHASWEQIDGGKTLGGIAGFAFATYFVISMFLLFAAPHI